jgi:hypothetical protein
MTYSPVMATKAQIMAFNKDILAGGFGLTSDEFAVTFDVIHEAVEAKVRNYLNRFDLTASVLASANYSTTMLPPLRMAVIMIMGNFFVWWKAQREGRVVQVGEVSAFLNEPKVFTKQIKEDFLDDFRIPSCGAVSPVDEEGGLDIIGTSEDESLSGVIAFRWDESEVEEEAPAE